MTVETAVIGALASVGLNNRIQTLATPVFLSISVSLPQLMSFAMVSLGLGEENKNDISCAVGLTGTFRSLGGSTATAIYTAIVNNTFSSHLRGEVRSALPTSPIWLRFSKQLLSTQQPPTKPFSVSPHK
ncbi:hypothetical protein K469DRAFT_705552 [Zopfia rhizophila CBS 207.26]|uniref:Uncharacterized protein n=1 Tax=Zopfia rhizophila CBS 207.26 TaxID=1314779 RepID=A0A6A6E518_9PEZI|nr:hypothetical protein K469DRAFT_705552 [Zopfia rhizophila CBS 207.26]